ncbi:MAG: beta-ketoacyl synthase N-terminal-like domain-containing protein [Clostridia bacterium]
MPKGRGYVVPAACAAGNYALALAQRLLHWNEADLVITGGVDAFSMVAFAGFQRLLSLAPGFLPSL